MAHYRKIDVSIWNDEKFSSLKVGSKLAYMFLITHPGMTIVGAMRASVAGLADEAGVSTKDFQDVFNRGLALYDDSAKCIFVPNFLKYQATEKLNPNIVKNWVSQTKFIPECFLKEVCIRNIIFYLKDFSESFTESFHDFFLKETGGMFDEVYGNFFSKESETSFGKIFEFLPERFVDYFRKPVSSKQLSKPTINNTTVDIGVENPIVIGDDGRWYESSGMEKVAA